MSQDCAGKRHAPFCVAVGTWNTCQRERSPTSQGQTGQAERQPRILPGRLGSYDSSIERSGEAALQGRRHRTGRKVMFSLRDARESASATQ
jgi:hypothetical protein